MSHHKHEHCHAQPQATEQDALQSCAYRLWEQAGRPEGQSEHFWMEAKARIAQVHRPETVRPHC